MTITIPEAALEALANKFWYLVGKRISKDDARLAAEAMLKNWPGMKRVLDGDDDFDRIILPITQETGNGN